MNWTNFPLDQILLDQFSVNLTKVKLPNVETLKGGIPLTVSFMPPRRPRPYIWKIFKSEGLLCLKNNKLMRDSINSLISISLITTCLRCFFFNFPAIKIVLRLYPKFSQKQFLNILKFFYNFLGICFRKFYQKHCINVITM